MMINILSIRCGLAFAPYLYESASAFLNNDADVSRVIRQAGSGLIIRAAGELLLRYQNREASLSFDDAKHYLATIRCRADYYDVERTSDEVVFASIDRSLLLSHPQSELWLEEETVAHMLGAYGDSSAGREGREVVRPSGSVTISAGGGGLLLSDQHNGRWVLLGADHIAELEQRIGHLKLAREPGAAIAPPVLVLKGMNIHLQSALKLLGSLEAFNSAGEVETYEEVTPGYYLRVARSTEGIELRDSNNRIALTPRESRKWTEIIRSDIERLKVRQVERGRIRTVLAEAEGGRWLLQWGDEVFVPQASLAGLAAPDSESTGERAGAPVIKRIGGFTLVLCPTTGGCVALTGPELGLI